MQIKKLIKKNKQTNNNSYYRKNKPKEMYTGAPEKCLEVFAFTKINKKPKAIKQTNKQTEMLSNSPSKTVQVHPWQKSRKNIKGKTKNKQTQNILIINNYNFTIF